MSTRTDLKRLRATRPDKQWHHARRHRCPGRVSGSSQLCYLTTRNFGGRLRLDTSQARRLPSTLKKGQLALALYTDQCLESVSP